jgi:hypothetical protein
LILPLPNAIKRTVGKKFAMGRFPLCHAGRRIGRKDRIYSPGRLCFGLQGFFKKQIRYLAVMSPPVKHHFNKFAFDIAVK